MRSLLLSATVATLAVVVAAPVYAETLVLKEHGISLTLPAGYTKGQAGTNLVFAAYGPKSGKLTNNINLVVQAAPGPSFPANMATMMVPMLKQQFPTYQMLKNEKRTVAGGETLSFVGKIPMAAQGVTLQNHQVMIIHGGKIYTFTLTASDKSYATEDPKFETMLKSIKWL